MVDGGYDTTKPNNGLPNLPPSVEVETKEVLKACIKARAALAELRAAAQLIPDQTVLINVIPLLEAKDSSEIENIVTTNDALFRQAGLGEDEADPATKEALRYRTALFQGFNSLKQHPLTTRTALEICRTVKGLDLNIRATPGTALKNRHTGEVIYTPPEGPDRIRDLMSDWEKFINAPSDLDPIVRMAIQHYQFEAIHPFPDGNGRTGRILNLVYLVQSDLLDLPILYLSRHILRTRGEYYGRLSGVTTRKEWVPWVLYILEATTVTAEWTNKKIRAIRALMDETAAVVRTGMPNAYSRELIDVIFSQAYCRIGHLVDRGIAKRETASLYLKQMAALGLLEEMKSGRDKVFLHKKYFDLLASEDHVFESYSAVSRAVASSTDSAPAKSAKRKRAKKA